MQKIIAKDIKVIFSDLFGVLIGPDYTDVLGYIKTTTKQPIDILYQKIFDEDSMHLLRGEISLEHFFSLLQYKIHNGGRLNFKHFKLNWMKMQIGVMPAINPLLLKKQSYKIVIITNTTSAHINQLKMQYNFIDRFNDCITSDKAQALKPSKEIFYYACDMLNIAPNQSIFIDDNKENVQVANSLGMCGYWYKSYTPFLKFIADI